MADRDSIQNEHTLDAWRNLHEFLDDLGIKPGQVGISVEVTTPAEPRARLQSSAEVKQLLGLSDEFVLEAGPLTGKGVFAGLKETCHPILLRLLRAPQGRAQP